MKPGAVHIVVAAAIVCFVAAGAALAEMWPTLDASVQQCVLIVRAKAVGDPDGDGMRSFEVIEVWKGQFRPSDFVPGMANGRTLRARDGQHGVKVVAGQEIIFFYTRHNQPPGRLQTHTTALPVTDGKVVYASTNRELREEMTVDEFRQRIRSAAGPTSQPATAPTDR